MTKQEQIEEIQKIIDDSWEFSSISAELGSGDGDINVEEAAKALYEAGYRKIMNGKELNSELDEEECDVVDDYTIGFATYLMQKRHDEVDRMQAEIKRLKKENKQLKTECALLDDELRIARQDTIDVLNKVKEKLNNTPNGWAYTTYIDELIKGV